MGKIVSPHTGEEAVKNEISEEDQRTWYAGAIDFLNGAIRDVNRVAEELGEEVIVAFMMTIEERDDFIEKYIDKEEESNDDEDE
jgi:hypothetical protein